MRTGTICLHFSYPDSIRTRARRFLCRIPTNPTQVCLKPLTRTRTPMAMPKRRPISKGGRELPGQNRRRVYQNNIISTHKRGTAAPRSDAPRHYVRALRRDPLRRSWRHGEGSPRQNNMSISAEDSSRRNSHLLRFSWANAGWSAPTQS
jgi:hypothetical protein